MKVRGSYIFHIELVVADYYTHKLYKIVNHKNQIFFKIRSKIHKHPITKSIVIYSEISHNFFYYLIVYELRI